MSWVEVSTRSPAYASFSDANCSIPHSLALAELYITVAVMVRRFDIELYETGPRDISIGREMGIGQPRGCSFSVRGKVTKIITE